MRAKLRAGLAACLITILLAIATATAVRAADLGQPAAPGVAVIDDTPGPTYHRTGFYGGVLVGYDIAQLQADSFSFSNASLMAGGFVGGQLRLSHVVLGVEGDYMLTDIKGQLAPGSVAAQTSYLASIRARVGYPTGPVLWYVTAGPAFTENKLELPGSGANSAFLVGAALGAGVEVDFGKTVFARLEAIHYALPDHNTTVGSTLISSSDQQSTIRLGLGFHF